MATENQDLTLVVTLNDNASAQMTRIRQDVVATTRQLQALKMPEVIKQLEQFTKDSERFGTQIRGMAEGIQEMLSSIPILGRALQGLTPEIERAVAKIPLGGRVAIFGVATGAAAAAGIGAMERNLAEFSRNALDIKRFADTAGYLAGEFDSFQKQLIATMDPQEAQDFLMGIGQAVQEFGDYKRRRDILQQSVEPGIAGLSNEQMERLVQNFRAGNKAGGINEVIEDIKRNRDEALASGMGATAANAQMNKQLRQLHIRPSALGAGPLRAPTKEELERYEQRVRLAKEQNMQWNQISQRTDDMAMKLAIAFIPFIKKFNEWLKKNGDSFASLASTEIIKDLRTLAQFGMDILKGLKAINRATTLPGWLRDALRRRTEREGPLPPGGPATGGAVPFMGGDTGGMAPGQDSGLSRATFKDIPDIGKMLPGSKGGPPPKLRKMTQAQKDAAWAKMPRSTNIEDLRNLTGGGGDNYAARVANTNELKKFTSQLEDLLSGGAGAPGAAGGGQGLLSPGGGVGGGGLGAALGYGNGARPYGSSVGAGSGRGAGQSSPGTGGGGTGRSTGGGGGNPADLPTGGGGFQSDRTWKAREAIEKELLNRGYTPEAARHAAAALVGNAISESGLNPRAVHDRGTGYGIYGARLERRDAMLKWLKENNYPPDSLEGQARYMAIEADSMPKLSKTLRRATRQNVGDVSDAITDQFERPAIRNYGRRRRDTGTALNAQPPKEQQQAQPGTPQTTPTQPAQPQAGAGGDGKTKGKMVFIHGLKDRYASQGGSVEQTEADARRIAAAKGLELVIVDNEAQARDYIKNHPGEVKEGVGFSAGANAIYRMRNDYPDIKMTPISGGAHGTLDNVDPKKRHMQQVGALADQLEQQNAQRQAQAGQPAAPAPAAAQPQPQAAQPQAIVSPPSAAQPQAGSGTPGIIYENQNAGRFRELNRETARALNAVSQKTGVHFEVFSGGIEPSDPGSPELKRSGRHVHGGAADVKMFVIENGKKRYLSPDNPADMKKAQQVWAESKRQGLGGIGASRQYMQHFTKDGTQILTSHIGGGSTTIWGGSGKTAGVPPYPELKQAFFDPNSYPATNEEKPPELPTGRNAPWSEDSPALVPLGTTKKAVRTIIDKSQANEIQARVDAKAKLHVTVDAPAKTKVEATGDGMFKNNVTVDRNVALEPNVASGV